MTHDQLWQQCLAAARTIVQLEQEQWPGCENAVGFEVGGGTQDTSSSSAFNRNIVQQKSHALPATLKNALIGNITKSDVPASLNRSSLDFLSALMGRARQDVPGLQQLRGVQTMDPGAFSGAAALDNIIGRNPYTTDYEQGTSDLYNRMFGQARALAQSGPINVRGAQARQGFELADLGTQQSINRFREVRGEQHKDAGIVQNAIQLASAIEQMRRGTQLQAIGQQGAMENTRAQEGIAGADATNRKMQASLANAQLAGELLGVQQNRGWDWGQGTNQSVTNTDTFNVGLCCFIFMEATNGELPWYVRPARDYFMTDNRRNGYRWMSTWLVPAMQRSRWLKAAVNTVMIKPFLKWGRWLFEGEGNDRGKTVCKAWFRVWDLLGKCGFKGNPEAQGLKYAK